MQEFPATRNLRVIWPLYKEAPSAEKFKSKVVGKFGEGSSGQNQPQKNLLEKNRTEGILPAL